MSKCKYINCEKEINTGEKYCKYHQNKIECIKKCAWKVATGAGAIAFAVVFKKKPPTKS